MNAKRLSPVVSLAAAVLLGAMLSGCSVMKPAVPTDRATGTLALAATIDLQSVGSVSSAMVTATNGGMRREAVLPVTGPTVSASFAGLPVGDWAVRIELLDEAGDATHVGETTVRVYPNETVSAELTAKPLESRLEIVADLSGFPGAETIENARVTFHNDRTVTLDQVEGEPQRFSGVKELPPGDYDFSISFYKSTLYASDRVYTSPWTHVHLLPGKTSRVVWTGQTGDTVIETSVVDMPLSPVNLELSVRDGEIWAGWEAAGASEPPASFRIYFQEDSFAAFELLAEVPGSVLEHPIEEVESASPEGAVAVTAVSPEGLESYRSAPVYFDAVVGP